MLDEYFGLSEKQTTFKIELVAGLTTFLTMAYIVFVNPSILSLEGIEVTDIGVVFLSGLFFLILTLLGLRKRLVEAIPESLVSAIAVGIGLFITFMGLVKLGIVVSDEYTLVKAGPLNAPVLIGLFGLLVMIFCEMKEIRGGLVAGILVSTLLAGLFGMIERLRSLIQ